MFALFQQLVDTVLTVIKFIGMSASSLLNLVRIIPQFSTYTAALFAWIPQPIAAFAFLGFSVSILLFVIGRDT